MNRPQAVPSIAAGLEPGNWIGYSCQPTGFAVRWLHSPIVTTAIFWDIHAWGIQCVPQDDEQLTLIMVQWHELCTPF